MTLPTKHEMLGEIPARFEATLAYTLRQERAGGVRRGVSRMLLLAVCLSVALGATGLAVGLRRTDQARAVLEARKALGTAYELTAATLGLFTYHTQRVGGAWVITFTGEQLSPIKLGVYTVTVPAIGDVRAVWSHDAVETALWQQGGLEAPVWGQPQMVEALQRKDAAWRAIASGTPAVQDGAQAAQTAAPGATPTDNEAERALALAGQALVARLAFHADTLSLFEGGVHRLEAAAGEQWQVVFRPRPVFGDARLERMTAKMGDYTVLLDAASGQVLEATWSLDRLWTDQPYTQGTWSAAPAYHAALLPWLLRLVEDLDAIASQYPVRDVPFPHTELAFTEEDAAAYDTRLREAGFPAAQFPLCLPGEGDIPRAEALAIARAALYDEIQPTEEELSAGRVLVCCTVRVPGAPRWELAFQFTTGGIFVDFGVVIDARTGEVLLTNSVTGANG